jgi:hypothetical protein
LKPRNNLPGLPRRQPILNNEVWGKILHENLMPCQIAMAGASATLGDETKAFGFSAQPNRCATGDSNAAACNLFDRDREGFSPNERRLDCKRALDIAWIRKPPLGATWIWATFCVVRRGHDR